MLFRSPAFPMRVWLCFQRRELFGRWLWPAGNPHMRLASLVVVDLAVRSAIKESSVGCAFRACFIVLEWGSVPGAVNLRPPFEDDAVLLQERSKFFGRRQAVCGCRRSEEHTSELQSLMRISYAVFCL